MFITGKMISIIGMIVSIIALLFVQKSRTISSPSCTLSKNEVICLLVIVSVSQLCVTGIQNHDKFHSYVTLPFLFCRNHTIWCMPRIWHQPSQVGKTYEWFHCWNCVGSSETVSDCPSVTVATLCWGFGTQQSLIFCCLHQGITTMVTLLLSFSFTRESFCIIKITSLGIFLLVTFSSFLVSSCTKTIELFKFNFIIGFMYRLGLIFF